MSIIFEAYRSPSGQVEDKGKGGKATIAYTVLEQADSATAVALARALAPLALDNGTETLVRQSCKFDPTGPDSWDISFDYGPEDDEDSQKKPEPGTWKFSFDTTGASHTVTVAKKEFSRHTRVLMPDGSSPPTAPKLGGAINYDGKTVKGVDWPIANGKFEITAYYEPTLVTPAMMRNFQRKTPRINSDIWLGFQPGEVLYWGTQGQGDIPTVAGQRVSPIALHHHFESSENIADLKPDGATFDPPIVKKGWQFVWYRFFKAETTDNQVVPVPAHAYVDA